MAAERPATAPATRLPGRLLLGFVSLALLAGVWAIAASVAQSRVLPPPEKSTQIAAQLPVDSATPKVDTAGMSQADVERIRHVRVVDVNTPDGRPLTAAELQKLTAKMKAFQFSSKRSIFTPPEQYFTLSGGQQDMVCLAKNGDLVSVNDPSCPIEIRKALLKKS